MPQWKYCVWCTLSQQQTDNIYVVHSSIIKNSTWKKENWALRSPCLKPTVNAHIWTALRLILRVPYTEETNTKSKQKNATKIKTGKQNTPHASPCILRLRKRRGLSTRTQGKIHFQSFENELFRRTLLSTWCFKEAQRRCWIDAANRRYPVDPPQCLAVPDFLAQELQCWVKAPSKRERRTVVQRLEEEEVTWATATAVAHEADLMADSAEHATRTSPDRQG